MDCIVDASLYRNTLNSDFGYKKERKDLNNFIQENMKRNIIYSLTGMLIFVLTGSYGMIG